MRDSLIEARIRSELWRAYALTRQRPDAKPAPVERRRALGSLRQLIGAGRMAPPDSTTPPD